MGNWDYVMRTLGRLGPVVKESSIKAQMKVAKEICRRVKAHIRNQDLEWQPLKTEYLDEKEASGANSRILWAYGNYYRAIEVWKMRGSVYVGVRKGKYTRTLNGKRSKIEIARIAAIHEFASGKTIPRRPLWNPTIKEMGGSRGLKQMYVNSLLYHLRMAGIPIKPFRNVFNAK
jgi:hypothetical protein